MGLIGLSFFVMMTLFHLWDLPGDVLAAPESASGLDRCNLSLSLSHAQHGGGNSAQHAQHGAAIRAARPARCCKLRSTPSTATESGAARPARPEQKASAAPRAFLHREGGGWGDLPEFRELVWGRPPERSPRAAPRAVLHRRDTAPPAPAWRPRRPTHPPPAPPAAPRTPLAPRHDRAPAPPEPGPAAGARAACRPGDGVDWRRPGAEGARVRPAGRGGMKAEGESGWQALRQEAYRRALAAGGRGVACSVALARRGGLRVSSGREPGEVDRALVRRHDRRQASLVACNAGGAAAGQAAPVEATTSIMHVASNVCCLPCCRPSCLAVAAVQLFLTARTTLTARRTKAILMLLEGGVSVFLKHRES